MRFFLLILNLKLASKLKINIREAYFISDFKYEKFNAVSLCEYELLVKKKQFVFLIIFIWKITFGEFHVNFFAT